MTASTLDRTSAIAVHQQLSEQLREDVGRLGPGAKLPTEEELVRDFGVSRTTVRRAVQSLVDEGLLVRRQGKGTFVQAKRPVQSGDRLHPFVESFAASGLTPVATLLDYRWVSDRSTTPDEVAAVSGDILLIRRLYTSQDEALAIANIYVPAHFGRVISRADIEEHPVYQVLQERAHREPYAASLILTFTPPEGDVATRLDVKPTLPIPRMVRVTKDADGEILECMVAHLRPEAFELRTTVTADRLRPVSYTFVHNE